MELATSRAQPRPLCKAKPEGTPLPWCSLTYKINAIHSFQLQSHLDCPLRRLRDAISDGTKKEKGGLRAARQDLPSVLGVTLHLSPVGGCGSLSSPRVGKKLLQAACCLRTAGEEHKPRGLPGRRGQIT